MFIKHINVDNIFFEVQSYKQRVEDLRIHGAFWKKDLQTGTLVLLSGFAVRIDIENSSKDLWVKSVNLTESDEQWQPLD